MFARTSLLTEIISQVKCFLCVRALQWELYSGEWWAEITQPCGWNRRAKTLLLWYVPPRGGKGREARARPFRAGSFLGRKCLHPLLSSCKVTCEDVEVVCINNTSAMLLPHVRIELHSKR